MTMVSSERFARESGCWPGYGTSSRSIASAIRRRRARRRRPGRPRASSWPSSARAPKVDVLNLLGGRPSVRRRRDADGQDLGLLSDDALTTPRPARGVVWRERPGTWSRTCRAERGCRACSTRARVDRRRGADELPDLVDLAIARTTRSDSSPAGAATSRDRGGSPTPMLLLADEPTAELTRSPPIACWSRSAPEELA
jgi:hypothetical protein